MHDAAGWLPGQKPLQPLPERPLFRHCDEPGIKVVLQAHVDGTLLALARVLLHTLWAGGQPQDLRPLTGWQGMVEVLCGGEIKGVGKQAKLPDSCERLQNRGKDID